MARISRLFCLFLIVSIGVHFPGIPGASTVLAAEESAAAGTTSPAQERQVIEAALTHLDLFTEQQVILMESFTQRRHPTSGNWQDGIAVAQMMRSTDLGQAVVDCYREKTYASTPLEDLELSMGILVPQVKIESFRGLNSDAMWGAFTKAYPGSRGYARISRVAFNQGMSRALVRVDNSIGLDSGTGKLLFFAHGEEGWVFVREELIWAE